MYTRHKVETVATFVFTSILAYFANADYCGFALTAITVVSISVAVYIAAISALLGSPYADRLKSIPDKKLKSKSQLGVMTTYLRAAGALGVVTITISCIYQFIAVDIVDHVFRRILASLSCGVFSLNVLYLWLVFSFMSTALINSAKRS